MKTAFWLAGATVLALAAAPRWRRIPSRSGLSPPSRPDRGDRQRHAQFVRARARSHGPQDGRQAGRGDLRGRPPEAGYRQAEDREAGAVRSGRLHRRLYLVERAAGLAQDRGRFADLPDRANAGPSQLAGELCSPYVFSTSWQNDQTPAAMGLYMNQKGVKSVFLIGPNYAAGRDMLAGVKSTFKGEVLGEEYTVWPSQLDFSAELSKARASKAEVDLRVLSGSCRRAVPQSICAGRAQAADAALHGLHHRRIVAAACRRTMRSAFPARRNG